MAKYYNCKCGEKHPIGEPCPNKWKYKRNNASEQNKKVNQFYSSKKWKDKREEIKQRDVFCQRCKCKFNLLTYENLEVHHIVPLYKSWEKRLESSNLITLCINCHRIIDIKNNGNLDFDWEVPEVVEDFEFR